MTTKKIPTEPKRFALYARTSTEDLQSPQESLRWQRARAEALIAEHGEITAVFHDIGKSRSLPWRRRPEATALLAESAQKNSRRFNAVVVAEPARAFYGGQFGDVFPTLTHYDVELWVPEVGGKVDPDSEAHDIVMVLFGGMSKGERNRIKVRVRTAMKAQAVEGRWLGGRPPYGYVLVDAGPHPNSSKARDGKRLKGLEPDPVAAPVIRRIFADYLAGDGLRVLADRLTSDGILSPSAHDPARNPHRSDSCGAWGRAALRTILTNPVYTGRKVYGRYRRAEVLVDPEDPSQGHVVRERPNPVEDWVWSPELSHEPLIGPEVFQAVQERFVSRRDPSGPRAMKKGRPPYALRGLVFCGACGRRMEGTTDTYSGARYLRCRLAGPEYARNAALEDTHPRSSYLREDQVLPAVNDWLAQIVDRTRLDETAKVLAEAAADDTVTAAREAAADRWAGQVADAEAKLAKYRELAETGSAPMEVVARWIAEAEQDRRHADAELARLEPDRPPTVDEVKALLVGLRRIVGRLRRADPAVLNDTFLAMGLRVTYPPKNPLVRVEIAPGRANGSVGEAVQLLPRGPVLAAWVPLRRAA